MVDNPVLPSPNEKSTNLLHPSFHDNRRHSALVTLAEKFSEGGCCGKKPTLTLADLEACGLTPPTLFVSSIGNVIPRSGWRAMCIYVYETLFRAPFPAKEYMNDAHEWGTIVANEIRTYLPSVLHGSIR